MKGRKEGRKEERGMYGQMENGEEEREEWLSNAASLLVRRRV